MQNEPATTESVLAIRMDSDLRDKIRAAAKAEERTESAFGRFHLSAAADAVLNKDCECQPTQP
jgi:uncharacterized protein (DUF1778 family)